MRRSTASSRADHVPSHVDSHAESGGQDARTEETNDPLAPFDEPDEPSDLDDFDGPGADEDSRWDAFLADDDEFDPLPDANDFWIQQD